LIAGKWYHVAFICNNYTTGQIIFQTYINGVLDATFSQSGDVVDTGDTLDFLQQSCVLDDVRIYDHALSLKEVQELATAKVLHYTFDDFQEPTENLAYTSGNIDWSTVNLTASVTRSTITTNSVYRITSGSTAGTFRINFNNTKLVNGKSYNLSYRYKIISGGTVFSMIDWCDTPLYNVVNTHGYSSAYGTRSTYDATFRFMDFTISANTVVEIWDLQLEEKPYATPFVNGTRTGTVRDCSGQDSDATLALATTPQWTSDSRLGAGTYSFGSGKVVAVSGLDLRKTFSISCWVKHDTVTGFSYFGQGTLSTRSGLHIWNPTSMPGWLRFGMYSNDTDFNINGILNTNGWFHMVFVYNHETFIKKCYINAVSINGEPVQTQSSYIGTGIFNIGGTYSVPQQYAVGYIDDVRIYATALTDTQVLELYQTRASLDDKGNFYA
jgi:hypothetical protein